jgi:hypothetical protein
LVGLYPQRSLFVVRRKEVLGWVEVLVVEDVEALAGS